ASTGRSLPASGDRRVQVLSLATGAQIHALRTKTVQVSGVASQQCINDDGGPPGCTDLPTLGLFLRLVPPFLCRSDNSAVSRPLVVSERVPSPRRQTGTAFA